jgi:hypothetical protein
MTDTTLEAVRVRYTNWRGETSDRRLLLGALRFGTTDWHPEPTWLILAFDVDHPAQIWKEFDLTKCDFALAAERDTTPEAPFARAAFINAIREEGTHQEACDYLQKIWNERCALAAERDALRADNDKLQGQLSHIIDRLPDWIKAIGEWDEGGEAALEEMQDFAESTDAIVSEVSGLTGLQKAVAELMDMHRDDLLTIAGLRAEVDRLRGALGPFADAADEMDEYGYDDENQAPVTAGDCREARAALDAKP